MLGLIITSLLLLVLMALPFYYSFKWAYYGTNVQYEPTWARVFVGLLSAMVLLEATLGGLALMEVQFAHKHVHHVRVMAANTVHPKTK